MIDFYTSEAYYVDHLVSVWLALPREERGIWMMPPEAVAHARELGVTGEVPLPHDVMRGSSPSGYVAEVVAAVLGRRDGPLAVASYGDLRAARRAGRRLAYFEHGAGISYGGDPRQRQNVSYAGGKDRTGVGLFLVPGRFPAERNRAAHPGIPVVEIGCPKLDRWMGVVPANERPVIGLAWHWDNRSIPETRSAFPHFNSILQQLDRDARWSVLGHAHAKADDVRTEYRRLRIEQARSADDLYRRADVLVADNTSALYEFAALDRPVVALNAPWYRRDVQHGLRFWQAIPGGQCDEPGDLIAAVEDALRDTAAAKRRRRRAVAAAYSVTDGTAGERAADALLGWAKAG